MTRGQRGSLALHCPTLSFVTPRRFIPAHKETLKICIDEVQACRPFFIGLLGERYGRVPGEDAFTSDLQDEQPWLSRLHGRSVTELEIIHGVLNNPRMAPRAFFYFRDPAYVARHRKFRPESEDASA